jgi:hypothetical protein
MTAMLDRFLTEDIFIHSAEEVDYDHAVIAAKLARPGHRLMMNI